MTLSKMNDSVELYSQQNSLHVHALSLDVYNLRLSTKIQEDSVELYSQQNFILPVFAASLAVWNSILPTEQVLQDNGVHIIPWPSMINKDHMPNKWFDNNHPKGDYCGEYIVGPMIHTIMKKLKLDKINIAIVGDSTTAHCLDELRKKKKYGLSQLVQGLNNYKQTNKLAKNSIKCKYYSQSGTSFNEEYKYGSFHQQAKKALERHTLKKYDAVLLIGGWNNDRHKKFYASYDEQSEEWHSKSEEWQFKSDDLRHKPSIDFYKSISSFVNIFKTQ